MENQPFRSPDPRGQPEEPASLVLAWNDPYAERAKSVRRVMYLVAILVAAGVVARAVPWGAWGVLAAGVIGAYLLFRRPRPLTLRVQTEHLVIERPGAEAVSLPLSGLRRVTLERRSAATGPSPTSPPVGLMGFSTAGPSVDLARVHFELEGGRPAVSLSDAFVRESEAVEAYAKLSTFLRAQGWLPIEERVAAESASDEEEAAAAQDAPAARHLRT